MARASTEEDKHLVVVGGGGGGGTMINSKPHPKCNKPCMAYTVEPCP